MKKQIKKIADNNHIKKTYTKSEADELLINELRKVEKLEKIKKVITGVFILLIVSLIFTGIYIFKSKNWVYKLAGESETFTYSDSLFIYDGKKYFLIFGGFDIKNNNITKNDIESVRLMCGDKLIIGADTFISGIEEENKGYNELFPKKVVNNLSDWYYEIKYKSNDGVKTEILKLNNKEIE